MIWRRLPLAALAVLVYFIYDVFGTFMVLQMQRLDMYSETPFAVRGAEAISSLMGIGGLYVMISFTGAVLLGVTGFSFLYKSQTVDFYESRPEKRSTRFANIMINGFLIYMIPSLLGMAASFLIAVVNGCAPSWLLLDMVFGWLFNSVIFLAAFGMSTLASLLTGTIVTAGLMSLFFFGAEVLVRLTIMGYRAAYYATFDVEKGDGILSNIYTFPVFTHIKAVIDYKFKAPDMGLTTETIMGTAMSCLGGAGINLLLFIVTTVLAYITYQKRKSEDAGKAVVFKYLEVFIKVFAGIFFSLDAGLFIFFFFSEDRVMSTGPVIVTIIIVTFVSCIILESIFAMNVRMAFNRAYQIPIIAVISIALLFIYKTGITGYDHYLPSADKVKTSYIVNYSYNSNYYDESEVYLATREFVERNMFLTDTDQVLKLAEVGEDEAISVKQNNVYDPENGGYWEAVVGWRLNDGREVTREILIPEDVDAGLMDNIVGSEEFMKGVYFLDDVIPIVEGTNKSGKKRTFTFKVNTEHGCLETRDDVVREFLEAYKIDLRQHYNFTLASYENPVGYADLYDNRSYDVSWPIFANYDHTIAFLESKGLWAGGLISPDEVEMIMIDKGYYDEEIDEYISDSQEIRDRNEINEVMNNSMSSTFYSAWQRNDNMEYGDYSVEVHPKEGVQTEVAYNDVYYRTFYKGKIPEFVIK